MQNLEKLIKGYKTFSKNELQDYQERYRNLAEVGQSPKIMVIGCSDSRVNPDLIFNTKPGELFVVRNVANLVPPFEPDDHYHGTSAALEFAITGLNVQHIVIMGHSLCGGIKACCDHIEGQGGKTLFIDTWMSLLRSCARNVLRNNPDLSSEDLRGKVEQAAIIASLGNLRSFPFVAERLAAGSLQIHGAYFDVRDAQLYALDQGCGEFMAVG